MEKNRLLSILKIKNVAALPALREWIDWQKPTKKPFHLTSGWVAKIIFGFILSTLTLFTCQIDLVEGKEGIYDSKKRLITLRESLRLAVENSHELMITKIPMDLMPDYMTPSLVMSDGHTRESWQVEMSSLVVEGQSYLLEILIKLLLKKSGLIRNTIFSEKWPYMKKRATPIFVESIATQGVITILKTKFGMIN